MNSSKANAADLFTTNSTVSTKIGMTQQDQLISSGERPTLFLELRAAIRLDHAVLNKAIFGSFPDCVPPKAENAYLYTAGMSVFGQIYLAIEESWDRLLEQKDDKSDNAVRYREMFTRLQTPLLARGQKLRSDLEYIEKHILPANATRLLAELRIGGSVFKQRIVHAIMVNPPVLLAYAWVMYLALFNGGRWMAEELVAAGPKFWAKEGDAEVYSTDVLSFWFFDDHSPKDNRQHGEYVKAEFCRHFDHAAGLVYESEQHLVVEESRKLFKMCVEMVDFMNQQELGLHLQALSAEQIEVDGYEKSVSAIRGYLSTLTNPITNAWSRIAG